MSNLNHKKLKSQLFCDSVEMLKFFNTPINFNKSGIDLIGEHYPTLVSAVRHREPLGYVYKFEAFYYE